MARSRQETTRAQPEVDDVLALERQVCFALAITNRSVLAIYRPLLEPLGLTHPQYLVMLALWDRSRPAGALSFAELSRTLQLELATLSPLVKRLESAGLLTRQRDAVDERQLQIDLTEAGVALRRQAEQIPAQVVGRLDADLVELQQLRTVLHRINAAALTALGRLA